MAEVLVVDDSKLMRDMVTACLRAASGLTISHAASGLDAIERLSLKRFDLLVLDLNMPDIGGLEVIEFVRGQDELQRVACPRAHHAGRRRLSPRRAGGGRLELHDQAFRARRNPERSRSRSSRLRGRWPGDSQRRSRRVSRRVPRGGRRARRRVERATARDRAGGQGRVERCAQRARALSSAAHAEGVDGDGRRRAHRRHHPSDGGDSARRRPQRRRAGGRSGRATVRGHARGGGAPRGHDARGAGVRAAGRAAARARSGDPDRAADACGHGGTARSRGLDRHEAGGLRARAAPAGRSADIERCGSTSRRLRRAPPGG